MVIKTCDGGAKRGGSGDAWNGEHRRKKSGGGHGRGKRQAKVISPGGYCWNPAATDCVLVVKGNELYVAGMPQEGTKGLRAGEVMLFSKGASVKVTNDGKILLHGDVYVQGDLYVNGQKMEVP